MIERLSTYFPAIKARAREGKEKKKHWNKIAQLLTLISISLCLAPPQNMDPDVMYTFNSSIYVIIHRGANQQYRHPNDINVVAMQGLS